MKRIYVTPEAEASCMLTELLIAQSGDFVSPSIAEDDINGTEVFIRKDHR